MKRILRFTLLLIGLILAAGTSPVSAQPEEDIKVFIDGVQLQLDVAPQVQNGRTMLPFRAAADALDIEVIWEPTARQIFAKDSNITLEMTVDSTTARVNNQMVILDAAPTILNGRTLLPARFFSETFGCVVKWDPSTRIVNIVSTPPDMKVVGFYALGDEKTSSWGDLFNSPYPNADKGNTEALSDLALGWYSLDETGQLLTQSSSGWQIPAGWEKVLEAAEKYRLKTQMVVHMTDGGGKLVRFLNNDEAVRLAADSIAEEAQLYQGVNLDFEGLGWNESGEELIKTRQLFNNFAKLLSEELKVRGLELTLTLHAPNSSYLGYDYMTLGKIADYIIVMAYDYGPKPEPENLVIQAVSQAVTQVPPEKLILGISAVSETGESLEEKLKIAWEYDLEGAALWRLGLITDEMWTVLKNY
ncbi:MAG: copper amine oxidase [Syntrophomonadaceae bacterium]|jgi:hypothetical protein|nr:copper amine oxidase [Syntrophomonadaceae bacterium]